ncbi:hypothetical protein [Kitasatospora sp. CB02891]|uniref:hypothetical protein n=1 Tax=Kitasatospora sp. CB02891 TaxID=2020329 RepID=UPI000C279CE8|nr:hypothetical protein [Kitasatospora sp. CB02891]PJN24058.1 hypothetical protein CG736_19370 [Kitasatospora sp. CB02891]
MTDTIHVRGEGGTVIAMDLPLHEAIANRLATGQLQRVDADGRPLAGDPAPDLPDKPPAQGAPKAAWIDWATAQGADPDEAEAMTKGDLIEKYGTGAVE